MDDGHFISFGTLFGGVIFFITAIIGGIIVFFTLHSWRENHQTHTSIPHNQKLQSQDDLSHPSNHSAKNDLSHSSKNESN